MKSPSSRDLDVYDFKEEDERAELEAGNCMEKFKNPNPENYSISKYEFLECAGRHISMKKDCSRLDAAQQSNFAGLEQDYFLRVDNFESRSLVSELEEIGSSPQETPPGKSHLSCAQLQLPFSQEPIDVILHGDGSTKESFPSSPASEVAKDDVQLNGYSSDPCFTDMEMEDEDKEVVLHPDYIRYQDRLYTGSQVTFSHTGIKINGYATHGHEFTNFEWGVDDLIDINCNWLHRAETVMIKLRLISKDPPIAVNADNTSGIIEEVEVAVVGFNLSEKHEKITCLNERYAAVWNIVVNGDIGNDDDSPRRRHYLPKFDEPFEEVVYPKGDSDAVSISKRDVDLLEPETFVNDTIIDFYIQHLKNQIPSQEKHRFHFFNSFFFRKLADLDKDPSSASDGRAAFLRVRKWTRKVNLFDKDYVFIPINFSLHWSLIVICHPGEVAKYNDDDQEKALKVPCILHMDSIKGSHSGLKNLIQSYLWEEWKERQKETSQDTSSKFLNLRFLPLELPQQENSFDCGLFLLHYLEQFLFEAPVNFSPFKISKFSNFLNVDWFLPSEVSLKRTLIQSLIFKLLENRSREMCGDERLSSKPPQVNKNETAVEFLSQKCSPKTACHGNLSNSQTSQGIEITLLSTSSMRNNQCTNNSSPVAREFFKSGTTAGSLLGEFQSLAHGSSSSYYHSDGAISQIQEDDVGEQTEVQFVYLPSGDTGFQPTGGILSQDCSIPYSSRGFDLEPSDLLGISTQAQNSDADSSLESSSSSSESSEDELGILETYQVGDVGPMEEEISLQKSPSMKNTECVDASLVCAIEDFQEIQNETHNVMEKEEDSIPLCEGNQLLSSPQPHNIDVSNECQTNGDCVVLELETQDEPASKKQRITPPPEEGQGSSGLTQSPSNDTHT